MGELISQLLAPQFLLDWATMAVSLFNTIVLLWLGITVLVNSERRAWGVWLAGGGLLLAGFFFVSHSAMLGHGLSDVGAGMDFWWQVGWVPVVTLPFAWYVVILWYSGFWDGSQTPLRRRHRFLFALAALAFVFLAALFLISNPLPPYDQLASLSRGISPPSWGLQVLAFLFPLYAVLCMGFSVDVVARPGPTDRLMGDLARRRARPWLAATSFVLLGVSLLVAGTTIWLVGNARQGRFADIHSGMQTFVYWFDLLTSALIAAATVLLGQAIVAYEIFTGKALPRRGFVRQWRSAVLFATIYAGIVGASLARQSHPIAGVSGILLITVLMSLFFAFFSWRSYTERDRYISYLRPFVTSQGLYDELLATSTTDDGRRTKDEGGEIVVGGTNGQVTSPRGLPSVPNAHRHPSPDVDATAPFYALCHDVLGVKVAHLVAVGPLSPLVGPPLTYPAGQQAKLPPLTGITGGLDSPQTMYVPVDPARYAGAILAVPLWSERGLIGVLLLGAKVDDGLYAQEEIEIARATGERLIDTQASAQMAQRLMLLQRQRLAESQVLDRRARRVLHDDVLPLLHTAMLELASDERRKTKDESTSPSSSVFRPSSSETRLSSSDALALLADAHRQISDLLRDMPTTVAPEMARLGLVGALRKAVEEELAGAFDGVSWQIDPQVAQHASSIPPLAAEVIYYAAREAIRNSARYGRSGDPSRPLHLKIAVLWHNGLEILVEDDGVGLGSSSEGRMVENGNGHANGSNGSGGLNGATGGSGQGLALHSTMMAVVGGSLSADSVQGEYTRVVMSLPVDG